MLGNKQIAVKRFLEKASYAWHQNAVREVVALCCIPAHPCIVRLLRAYVENRRVHMVFPRLKDTLHVHLKNNNASAADCWKWSKQIIQGLAHMHLHGFMHRDLKLENIMLDYENNAVIVDLGMARRRSESDTKMTGTVCSLWTRAPEVHDGLEYTEKMDSWSLGIVMLSIAAGKYIFRTTNEQTIMEGIRKSLFGKSTDERAKILSLMTLDMGWKFFGTVAELLDFDPSSRLSVEDLAARNEWKIELPECEKIEACEGAIVPGILNALVEFDFDMERWIYTTLTNMKRSQDTAAIACNIYRRTTQNIIFAAASCSLACKLNEVCHITPTTWASASSCKVRDIYAAEEEIMVTLQGRLFWN